MNTIGRIKISPEALIDAFYLKGVTRVVDVQFRDGIVELFVTHPTITHPTRDLVDVNVTFEHVLTSYEVQDAS